MVVVRRNCTEIPDDAGGSEGDRRRFEARASLPLEAFRGVSSYVLLADPGAGKTTAFWMEKEELGSEAFFVSARDFLALDPSSHPPAERLIVMGDFNQVIGPGARVPGNLRTKLMEAFPPGMTIVTADIAFQGRKSIDHIVLSKDLFSVELHALSATTKKEPGSLTISELPQPLRHDQRPNKAIIRSNVFTP